MNRTIKIRVWDKTLSRFVSPSSLFVGSDGKISGLDINDCVIQEFTGIKDVNGTEIYEGDIVKAVGKFHKHEDKYVIEFLNGMFSFTYLREDIDVPEPMGISFREMRDIQIVGNILKYNEPDTSTL